MKVAEYIGIFGTGGIEHVVLQLFQHINHQKFDIDFVIDFWQEVACEEEIYSNNGRIRSIFPAAGEVTKAYQKVLKAWHFYRLLKKEKYDIVHMHLSYPSTLLYCFIAKLAGVRVRVVQSHASNYGDIGRVYRKISELARKFFLPSATHLLAVSHEAGKWMFGNRKYDILSNGIEVDKFTYSESDREHLRKHYNLDEETLVIGHVGRFSFAKNHEFLVDIYKEILKKQSNAMLLLIGEGILKEDIVRRIEQLGIRDKVLMVPFTSSVAQYYQMMDAFVFPSRYEGFGIAALEAQVSGLPVWISNEVPKEVELTDNIYSLSLDKTAEEWANNIMERLKKFVRRDCLAAIENKGIDIKEKSKWLENYYLTMSKGSCGRIDAI